MSFSKITRTLVLNEGSETALRQQILKYFHDTFSIDEMLYQSLADNEAFYLRADPLRHPIIFYLGHTAVFIVNKLTVAKLIAKRINPEYESMFAIGVDEMSWDDLNMAHYNWPPVEDVLGYRNQVRGMVDDLISTMPLQLPITWDSPWWAIIMSIEHARIHLETSSVLIRQLPLERVRQLDYWSICPFSGEAPQNEMISVPSGDLRLGKAYDHPLYGWDNEYGSYQSHVEEFKASKYLCSNREFLHFVKAGGYNLQEYWTPEGWAWKEYQKAQFPRFWIVDAEGCYKLRTMASLIPMPWNWPVEVNYLEAKAFCNWKTKQSGKAIRLPSEEEWYLMRDRSIDTDQPYWNNAPGNINLEYWASSCPVDHFKTGDFCDLIGNVWQWTETPISGFPGFHVHPYYDDFSTPTFDGKHNLIKGGSWISTGNEATRDSRYAFRRHFYQHAGFRYVESDHEVQISSQSYESDEDIITWCDTNWGSNVCSVENFSQRLVSVIEPHLLHRKCKKALDLGCKTGRSTFELARHIDYVQGLDITARLIKVATDMKERGFIRYIKREEGEIESYVEKHLWEYGLDDYRPKTEFMQADPSNLLTKYSGYDLIVLENVLSSTSKPSALLQTIPSRLHKKGLLVIADSYDWDVEICPKQDWIGAIRKDGEPYSSYEALSDILRSHFEALDTPTDVYLMQRKNQRNHSLKIVQISIWQKI